MTFEQMAAVMDKVFEECHQLRAAGQKEYARGDAFGNFNRIALLQNRTREDVLMTYALKHLDGILSHIEGNTSQREDVRGRIDDLIVYLCLLRGMIDENEGIIPQVEEALPPERVAVPIILVS